MAMYIFICLVEFLLGLLLMSSVTNAGMSSMNRHKSKLANFDVKPGAGSQQFTTKLGGVECIFDYKAQGGTKEEWALSLFRDKSKKEWLCVVERPSGHSYLFFEEFQLTISGAQLEETLLERQPGVPLADSEYMVMKDDNYVKQWDGKFNSQLTKVQVYAVKSPSSTKEL